MSAPLSTILVDDPILNLNTQRLQSREYQFAEWQGEAVDAEYRLTFIHRELDAEPILELLNHLLAIGSVPKLITRLSANEDSQLHAVEISLGCEPSSIKNLRKLLPELSEQLNSEISIRHQQVDISGFGLACFDMDSTLIQVEVIDELAKLANVGEQVSQITERAMRGELDFNQSFEARMALLNGLDTQCIEMVKASLPIMDGAPRLLANLHHHGIKTAIFSGGFVPFAEHLQALYGFALIQANTLDIADNKLTGKVVHPIVNADMKAELLAKTATEYGLSNQECIAVGDGSNDLKMLDLAGFGVAFRAKPVVRAAADYSIRAAGLESLLFMLGLKEAEWI